MAGNEADRLDLIARYLEDRTGYVLLGKISVGAGFQGLFSRAGGHNDVAQMRGAEVLGNIGLFLWVDILELDVVTQVPVFAHQIVELRHWAPCQSAQCSRPT